MTISLSSIDTLVWDLDGTLVDSASDIAASVNNVLSSYQLSPLANADVRTMIGNGASKLLERAFVKAGASDIYDSDESYRRFLAHYEDHCCDTTVFYPGMEELLSGFRALGYKQGVCTNKPVKMANSIVDRLSLSGTFTAVVGGDSTPFRKPDAQPLRLCLELLGSKTSTALMIGDSAADVGVARAANVPVVLFSWGYTDDVHALGADYVVENSRALFKLLNTPGQE